MRSTTYANPTSYQEKPAATSDASPTPLWPLVNCTRPVSSSFSQAENQEDQFRTNRSASLSFTGSSSSNHINPARFPNDLNIQSQTLYSINQSTKEDAAASSRKRPSLVDFPVPEIKRK